MTILVTGGAGYIGSHAVRALQRQGLKVVVLDNLVYGHRAIVEQVLQVPLVVGQLGDRALLEQLLSGAHPASAGEPIAAVLHFAAYSGHVEAFKELLRRAPHQVNVLTNEEDDNPVPPLWNALNGTVEQCWFPGHLEIARILLPLTDPTVVLETLAFMIDEQSKHASRLLPLYAEAIAAQPMKDSDWDLVPQDCPYLLHAMPAVLSRSTHEAGLLVRRLDAEDCERLRVAAMCLYRAGLHQHTRSILSRALV